MTVAEARTAVRLLNDAYQALVHEIHRTYPPAPQRPAAAALVRQLQQVMGDKGWPSSHFLAVDAVLRNQEHRARDAFERQAVQSLKFNDTPVEQLQDGHLRVALPVPMEGDCTACHWTEEGAAGKGAITWNIPVR